MQTKSAYLDKTIILEGCNGEWAQERYLPFLADRAAKGNIELWAIDRNDEILLENEKTQESRVIAQAHDKAHYLNKKKDKPLYNGLSDATYVFIVTPDRTHSQIAEFWLEHLAPNGKIFIEKPLDASMKSACKLRKRIKEENKEGAVFVFDHYLAIAHPLIANWNSYLKPIGRVERIEFHILESSTIKPNRVKTLDKGIIFDLLGHVLTLSGALIEQRLTPSISALQRAEIKEVKAAQYSGSPIGGETFSKVEFTFGNVEVASLIGKGIGTRDDKVMIVHGTRGMFKINFKSKRDAFEGKLEARHVETFLKELIDKNKQPISIPGVLDFDTAFEILTILDRAKGEMAKAEDYRVEDSVDSILAKF